MDKLQKAERREELKLSMMLQAAQRWNGSVRQGFKSSESGDRAINVIRIKNHTLREAIRSRRGMTELFNDLSRVEEAQINTWDAENLPPHSKAALAGLPVARIIDANTDGVPKGFGTGFLISDDLFITNCHVFPDIDYATECQANFSYEYNSTGTLQPGIIFNLQPERFFISEPSLDFAIIAISNVAVDGSTQLSRFGCIQLIETSGKIIKGDDLNIIQYPLGGHKQYACKQNQVTQLFDEAGFVQYITDTARASSGSPCFNKFWELAALHHCAIPEVINKKIIDRNGNPWNGRDEEEIRWVANEGISISKIVDFLRINRRTFPTGNLSYLDKLLGTVGDPLFNETDALVRENKINIPPITDNKNAPTMNTYNFNFYGTTNLYFGVPAPSSAAVLVQAEKPVTPRPGEEADAIKFDEDYDSRNELGYDEEFLEGIKLALPKVTDADVRKDLYKEDGDVLVLNYYNYSLVMNKKRRFCHWTAVNVNYDPSVRSKKSREEFGRDTWRRDPRVGDNYQVIGTELYAPAKRVEQGHIVRRDDACWGDTAKFIEFANSDTFHYTNCTPQLEPFNRANPRKSEGYEGIHGIWGALEEHIKKELKNVDNKAVIFAGPYLSSADPNIDYVGDGKIKTPMKFWKVVCVTDESGKLFSYGFWLDQKDVWDQFGPGIETLDFRKFKKQQIRISEITKKTKVEFDNKVYDTDILKNNNFNEADEGALSYTEVANIQLRPK
jgi:endonuclease G